MGRPLFAVLLLVAFAAVIEAASWNYDPNSNYGPHNWNKLYSDYCDPDQFPRQSPIDIKKGLLRYDPALGPMKHDNFETKDVLFQAQNNGHTVQLNIDGDVESEGGPVGDVHYYALQLHFHWGDTDEKDGHGSEHTILGKQHKAEMHIVHVNHKHSKLDISEVVKKGDGLLVLGVFIDIADPSKGQVANAEFDKIIAATQQVKNKAGAKWNLTRGSLNLEKLLPNGREEYYTYPGGLTTPTCHGAVTWVVYKQPVYVSKKLLEEFYTVKDAEGKNLTNIFRPPQPLNERIVRTTSKDDGMIVSGSSNVVGSLVLLLCASLMRIFL